MLKRVLTAVVALPILGFAIVWDQPWLFLPLVLLGTLAGAFEFFQLCKGCGLHPHLKTGLLFTILILVFSGSRAELPFGREWDWILVLSMFCFFLISLIRENDFSRVAGSVGSTMLGSFYLGGLMAYLPRLKLMGTEFSQDLLLLIFILVFSCDSGAMFMGKAFGKHKMAPRVSPKKSWQGFFGGILGAAIALGISRQTFFPEITWVDVVLLSFGVTIVGQLGDLFVSQMKRGADAKDSGAILPGHGGLMDRLDSLLFAVPMLFYYFRLAWPLWGEGTGL